MKRAVGVYPAQDLRPAQVLALGFPSWRRRYLHWAIKDYSALGPALFEMVRMMDL